MTSVPGAAGDRRGAAVERLRRRVRRATGSGGGAPRRLRGMDGDALVAAARADWAAGRRAKSLDHLRQALVLLPGRADLWFLYAQRSVELRRSEVALEAVKTALDLRPWHLGALELLTELVRVRDRGRRVVHAALSDLVDALPERPREHRGALDLLIPARFESAAAVLAQSPDAVTRAAALLWSQDAGEDVPDPFAGLSIEEARLAETIFTLGRGRVGRAVELLTELPDAEVPVDSLRRAIRRQLALNHPKRSRKLLREYTRVRPDDQWGLRKLAECDRLAEVERTARPDGEPSNYQLMRRGFPFDDASATPLYEPAAGKAFYLLHNSLPYASAGYATRSHGLLRGLTAEWDMLGVTRVGFPFDSPGHEELTGIPPRDEIDGVRYARLSTAPGRWLKNPITRYVAEYAAAVEDLAREERPFVIHAASNHWNGLTAVQAARHLGIPSVYEVRGLWEVTRASRNPDWLDSGMYRYIRRMEADAATAADRVIAITEGLRDEMIDRGVPAEKISVVPNGVDTRRFVPLERDVQLARELGVDGKTVIGYVGSVLDYEGLDLLVRSAAELDRERSDFHVLIVGDGAEREQFEALALELGVLGRVVTFVGRVPHAEVERYYSLIDIAPFPRLPLEVCELVSPLKPFEAMAMGKAVVASDVRALGEIFTDGVTGVLHAKGDMASLTRVLRELLDSPTRVRSLGEAGRRFVEQERDWATLAGRVSDIYRELQAVRPRQGHV